MPGAHVLCGQLPAFPQRWLILSPRYIMLQRVACMLPGWQFPRARVAGSVVVMYQCLQLTWLAYKWGGVSFEPIGSAPRIPGG